MKNPIPTPASGTRVLAQRTASVLALASLVSGQPLVEGPTEEQRRIWNQLFREPPRGAPLDANGDESLDRPELEALLRSAALRSRSSLTETRVRSGKQQEFDRRIRSLSTRLVNGVDADPARGDRQIPPDAIVSFLAHELADEVGGGTIRSVLTERFGVEVQADGQLGPKDDPDTASPWSVRIRRSFLVPNESSQPATINWTNASTRDETLDAGTERRSLVIDASVVLEREPRVWRPASGEGWLREVAPVFGAEIRGRSGTAAGSDQVVVRAGASGAFSTLRDDLERWSLGYLATFDFLTDDDLDAEAFGGTLQLTVSDPANWIGRTHWFLEDRVGILWRPFLGLTYAKVEDDGGVTALEEGEDRLTAYGRIDLTTTFGEDWTLSSQWTAAERLDTGGDVEDLLESSLQYLLFADEDKKREIKLQLAYVRGGREPLFLEEDRWTLGFGVLW